MGKKKETGSKEHKTDKMKIEECTEKRLRALEPNAVKTKVTNTVEEVQDDYITAIRTVWLPIWMS